MFMCLLYRKNNKCVLDLVFSREEILESGWVVFLLWKFIHAKESRHWWGTPAYAICSAEQWEPIWF